MKKITCSHTNLICLACKGRIPKEPCDLNHVHQMCSWTCLKRWNEPRRLARALQATEKARVVMMWLQIAAAVFGPVEFEFKNGRCTGIKAAGL